MSVEQTLVANALLAWKQALERLHKVFSSLSDEQLQKEIAPGKNRYLYLYGHYVAAHDSMHTLLDIGPRLHPELEAPFLKEKDRAVADLPSAAELGKLWDEVHDSLNAAMEKLTAEDWTRKHTAVSVEDFATAPLRNRMAILLSRTSHIAYHLGQFQLHKD
jgi:hypothetical protein